MIRLLAVVTSVLTALATPPGATARPMTDTAACSSVGGSSTRLELSDGRIVSIDVRSLARSGDWVLAAGRYGYVFPRDAQSRTSPMLVDSLIGVLVDGRGRVALVPNPLAPVRVSHPRVAAAPNDAFHLVFATAPDAVGGRPAPADTASLWYATFSARGWSRPSIVAKVRGAWLSAEVASTLLERDGELSFAFPFFDDRGEVSEGGVILLRRRNGRWTSDTMRTHRMPAAVRIAHDARRSSIVAVLVMTDQDPEKVAEKLYVARFDSSWSTPRQIAGDGVRAVMAPALARTRTGFAVAWVDWRRMQASSSQLHRLHLDTRLTAAATQPVDSGEVTNPFEMVVVDQQYPLWLYHNRPFGESISLMMSVDSTLRRLRPIAVPFRNPIASTVALSGNRFLVFTQKPAMTENEPMAASYMTPLEIRCPTPARR